MGGIIENINTIFKKGIKGLIYHLESGLFHL